MKEKKTDPYADEKIVDNFAERFYAGEYQLKPEANTTMFLDSNGKSVSLRNLLSEALANYMTARSVLLRMCKLLKGRDYPAGQPFYDAVKELNTWRNACVLYITHAKNRDLIIETECLSSRLTKVQQEVEMLKAENLELKKKNFELNRFSKNFPNSKDDNEDANTESGDLHRT